MGDREGILIVGGGGHGVVVAETAAAAGLDVVGFLDDDRDAALAEDFKRLGGLGLLEHVELHAKHRAILGLGDVARRRSLIDRIGSNLVSVVHPTAWISPSANPTATSDPGADR